MIRVELARIIISENNEEQVIFLKETQGERTFPIVIGIWEAVAIDRNLKQKKMQRPMTHDLIENVIRGLDASLERIVVSDLKDRTFYAKLLLRRNGKTAEIDSRPSDAIALAVQMQVPIFVEERVFTKLAEGDDAAPGMYDPEGDEPSEFNP